MKSYIKSLFLAVLFVAIFNIGIGNTYAKNMISNRTQFVKKTPFKYNFNRGKNYHLFNLNELMGTKSEIHSATSASLRGPCPSNAYLVGYVITTDADGNILSVRAICAPLYI